jgi:hypothetical protein
MKILDKLVQKRMFMLATSVLIPVVMSLVLLYPILSSQLASTDKAYILISFIPVTIGLINLGMMITRNQYRQNLQKAISLLREQEDAIREIITDVKQIVGEYDQNLSETMEQYENKLVEIRSIVNELNRYPWQKSRPYKRDRDKIIWDMREEGYTWEQIAEKANCGVSTAKEVYDKLKSG